MVKWENKNRDYLLFNTMMLEIITFWSMKKMAMC